MENPAGMLAAPHQIDLVCFQTPRSHSCHLCQAGHKAHPFGTGFLGPLCSHGPSSASHHFCVCLHLLVSTASSDSIFSLKKADTSCRHFILMTSKLWPFN